MLENYLIKGLLVGLVFGVPAGAIGTLTIQRTLAGGFRAGFFTGVGSSVADVLYACIGVFGLTVVSDFLLAHQMVISLVGGALIVLLGLSIFLKKGDKAKEGELPTNYLSCFASSFAIAIANPATILSFFIAFASFGISEEPMPWQGIQLVLGILIGTMCWWGLLSGIVAAFRGRITEGIYQKLNRLLGGLLILFGGFVIGRVLLQRF